MTVLDRLLANQLQILPQSVIDQLPDTQLTQYLKEYLVSCRADNKSEKTTLIYGRFVGYFIRFLAEAGLPANLSAINLSHIRLFIVSLQERRLTPETVSSYYRSLHSFFNWLEGEGYLLEKNNPFNAKNLHAPHVPKKHVRGMPTDVLNNVISLCSADHTFIGMRNYAIVLVFLDTGIRQQEMAGMKLSDIFFEQGLVRVMGKGSKERIVKMGEITRQTLLHYLLARKDNLDGVWVTEEGRPLKQAGINIAIRRIAQRAEIPSTVKHGTHVYRHTAATTYLRNKGNVKCLQELLGHENIKTTMKYVDALGPEAMIEDHKVASPVDNLLAATPTRRGSRWRHQGRA